MCLILQFISGSYNNDGLKQKSCKFNRFFLHTETESFSLRPGFVKWWKKSFINFEFLSFWLSDSLSGKALDVAMKWLWKYKSRKVTRKKKFVIKTELTTETFHCSVKMVFWMFRHWYETCSGIKLKCSFCRLQRTLLRIKMLFKWAKALEWLWKWGFKMWKLSTSWKLCNLVNIFFSK